MKSLQEGWDDFKKGWNKFWSGVGNYGKSALDTYTGVAEQKQNEKAQSLAEESQSFNESYSKKQLEQNQAQFEKSQALAEENLAFQRESADKNFQMQQDVFNAQQRENELTREREDTAYQRSVADLKAAGLSPLMASSGASASTQQVGSTPQYDSSGIGNAFGSYIQMAKEYAELRNMAQGNYLTRRQQAINERIGAAMALSQMYQSRRQIFANNALNGFNLAANVSHIRKQNKLIDEQIQNAKDMRNWSNDYGWRNLNNWAVLSSALKDLGSAIGISKQDLLDAIGNINPVNFNNYTSNFYDGTDKSFENLKDKVEILKGSDNTKYDYDNMIKALSGKFNPSQKEIENWYQKQNLTFKKQWAFDDFKQAVTGSSKFLRSSLLKFLMFGNSGNL